MRSLLLFLLALSGPTALAGLHVDRVVDKQRPGVRIDDGPTGPLVV
jgi:hypothetical protein